jgi:glycosyltransferase involved in cell wall biosynthesis
LLVYADKDPRNREAGLKNVKLVWTPTFAFPIQILRQVLLDGPDLVHIQHEINMYGGPFTAALFPFMLFLLRLARLKIVVTIHSVVPMDQIDTEFMRTFSWPASRMVVRAARLFFLLLYRSTTLFASRTIVHSRFMAMLLEKHYGVPREKIAIIPIGVPVSQITKGESPVSDGSWRSSLRDKKIILYFGYIIRRKGLEYLIEAFEEIQAQHPDYVLVLAGGELDYQRDYARSLHQDVKRRGLDRRILFTSFIKGAEIEKLFAQCEFVVLPYTYSISSSLPLSFAMQYAKPVIATNLGTLAEEVEEGVTGFLVPARDSSAISAAIQRLIDDPALLHQLCVGTRERARQRSWEVAADQTLQVYRGVPSRSTV